MKGARLAFLCLVTVAALSVGGVVLASSTAATPAVPWHVVSSGGAFAAAADLTLDGSIGQAIVGWSASPRVTLHAGYWQALVQGVTTFLPLVLK